MAVKLLSSMILVTGTGDQVIKGPIDILAIVVPNEGTVILKKRGTILLTLSAGTHQIKLRSASNIIVNGACSISMR